MGRREVRTRGNDSNDEEIGGSDKSGRIKVVYKEEWERNVNQECGAVLILQWRRQ